MSHPLFANTMLMNPMKMFYKKRFKYKFVVYLVLLLLLYVQFSSFLLYSAPHCSSFFPSEPLSLSSLLTASGSHESRPGLSSAAQEYKSLGFFLQLHRHRTPGRCRARQGTPAVNSSVNNLPLEHVRCVLDWGTGPTAQVTFCGRR